MTDEAKTSPAQKIPEGLYRLKATDWFKNHGHHCLCGDGPGNKVKADEVGEVQIFQRHEYRIMALVFQGGRRVMIGISYGNHDSKWILFEGTLENFAKVRPGKSKRGNTQKAAQATTRADKGPAKGK